MSTSRARRTPEAARRAILDEAEALLAAGGVHAVQVRAVAARVGMTDAGVNHHFANREGLLEALLRHCGRKIRDELDAVVGSWLEEGAHLGPLVHAVAALYRRGYGELALSLYAAGWRDTGAGMLERVVRALHEERMRRRPGEAPALDDTRLAVAALHQALAIDPVHGAAFRRSAGLTGRAARDHRPQLEWWTTTLEARLGIPR